MIKKISIALSILLCIGLITAITLSNRQQKKVSRTIEEMNNRVASYNVTIAELNAKIKELQENIATVNKGCGTVQFIFTDPAEAADELFALPFSEHELKGIAALSLSNSKGLTAEKAGELTERGFKFCYYYVLGDSTGNTADAFSKWLTAVSGRARELGITAEPAVLFEKGAFSEEFVPMLKNGDIKAVIHLGDVFQEEFTAAEDEGLILCDALNISDASDCFGTVNEYGGNAAVIVNSGALGRKTPDEVFKHTAEQIAKHNINVTDFTEMLRIQKGNRQRLAQSADVDDTVERYRDRIRSLEDTIRQIESEYNDKIR